MGAFQPSHEEVLPFSSPLALLLFQGVKKQGPGTVWLWVKARWPGGWDHRFKGPEVVSEPGASSLLPSLQQMGVEHLRRAEPCKVPEHAGE